jgi:hypothetical protein
MKPVPSKPGRIALFPEQLSDVHRAIEDNYSPLIEAATAVHQAADAYIEGTDIGRAGQAAIPEESRWASLIGRLTSK